MVGFLDAGQLPLDGHLDAEFLEDREQFPPLVVPPQTDEPRAASVSVQRSSHGVGQERGQVVYRGSAVNRHVGQERIALLGDDHPHVMRIVLHDRLGQRLEVGFPGLIDLREPFQAALDEGRTLAELEFLLSHGVIPRRCVGCGRSSSYPNAPVHGADEPWRPLRHEAGGEERPNIDTSNSGSAAGSPQSS